MVSILSTDKEESDSSVLGEDEESRSRGEGASDDSEQLSHVSIRTWTFKASWWTSPVQNPFIFFMWL